MKSWDVWRAVEIQLSLEAEGFKAIEKHFPRQDVLMLEGNRQQEHGVKYQRAVTDDSVKLELKAFHHTLFIKHHKHQSHRLLSIQWS